MSHRSEKNTFFIAIHIRFIYIHIAITLPGHAGHINDHCKYFNYDIKRVQIYSFSNMSWTLEFNIVPYSECPMAWAGYELGLKSHPGDLQCSAQQLRYSYSFESTIVWNTIVFTKLTMCYHNVYNVSVRSPSSVDFKWYQNGTLYCHS